MDMTTPNPEVPSTAPTPPPKGKRTRKTGEAKSTAPNGKQRRGFAAMTPEKQAAIASLGGKASHTMGKGHEWTKEEAQAAGRKGGAASRGGLGKSTAAV